MSVWIAEEVVNVAETNGDVQNITVGFRLSPKLHEKVRAVAKKKRLTQSAVITLALEEYFEGSDKIDSLEERLRAVEEYLERNR